MIVELTGKRVRLSAPTLRDADRIAELCQDATIAGWTAIPTPYGRAHAEEFVTGPVADGWMTGGACTWAMRDSDGALHGMIDLHDIAERRGELGFWLAPAARGKGLMAEAVHLVLDFGFAPRPDGLGLERIEWFAYQGNAASAAVARRAGFRFEGARRLGGIQRGVRRDDWGAALLPTDPRVPADGWPEETFHQAAQ
jgi:RimJ/RimL family protein N-acetyltransferase